MDEASLIRELRRSEQRLRTVLDSAADLVVLIGPTGELLYTSQRATKEFGSGTLDEHRPVLDFIHPEDLEELQSLLASALATRGPIPSFSCRLQHADGSWREMEGTGVNLLDDPDVEALVVGLRDMTERRRLERMFLRLHRLNTVLAEANEAVLRATDPQELLTDACRIAVELGGLGAAWVAMLEDGDYVARAQFGFERGRLDEFRGDAPPLPNESPAVQAARTRDTVVVPDITAGPSLHGWRDFTVSLGLRSSLHLPLLVDGEPIGVLTVYGTTTGFFDEAATTLLERLAGNIAYGLATLEHARRRAVADAALERRTRQQESVARLGELALASSTALHVAEAATHAVVAGLDAEVAGVLRLEPGGEQFRVVAGSGWQRGTVGSVVELPVARPAAWVVRNRTPLVVEDYSTETRVDPAPALIAAGVSASILVPIEVDGRMWGTLTAHSRAPRQFELDDVSFVQSLANIIAASVAHQDAVQRLRHQALHDPLTGLPNRVLLEDRLDQSIERRRRGGPAPAVAVLDVDGFRLVNDTLGPSAGDELLRAIGQRLALVVEPGDTIARLAADEFAVVRDHGDDVELAAVIRSALAEPIDIDGRLLSVTVSLGTAHGTDAIGLAGADLLQRALSALHLAKAEGRGRHRRHDTELEAELAARFDLQADLSHAVASDELELWYQPIVDTGTGAVVGAEALLRWQHPTRGLVPPGDFIPLAEETGLIVPIGAWVIEEACRAMAPWARWAAGTGRPFHVSVNLSAVQLADAVLVEHVDRCLRNHGLHPSALRMEITESVLFSERDASSSVLHRLHDLGVGLVVDDFGTGYSSLSYLQRFPLRGLKIDRTFTATLGVADPQAVAIVEAIVGMANALGLETVAEGVEEEGERAQLQRLGCAFSQGWLFGRPVVAADFDRVLRASAPAPPRPAARVALERTVVPLAPETVAQFAAGRFTEDTLRTVVEGAPDLVTTFDRDLRYLYANPAAAQLIGRARDDIIGRRLGELGVTPDSIRRWEAALRSVFLTGQTRDVEFTHDDALGRRWFSARLVPELVNGQVATVSLITRDVTDDRLASAVTSAAPDRRTGLLGRLPFLRLVGGLRHGVSGRFGVVRVRFADQPPSAEAGASLRTALRAGDVACRWSSDEIVVLRHPLLTDGELDELGARLVQRLRPLGATAVEVRMSVGDDDSPERLLEPAVTPSRGASGSAARGAAPPRPAMPAAG